MTKASSGSRAEPGLLFYVETLFALTLARMLVLLPLRLYGRALGRGARSPRDVAPPDVVRVIGNAVMSLSRQMPWRSKCLEEAIATKLMLRRRKLANTMYVAVARDAELEAHAWVCSGDACVVGQADFDRFTVVATFADEGTR
jgi:hypothetical protein